MQIFEAYLAQWRNVTGVRDFPYEIKATARLLITLQPAGDFKSDIRAEEPVRHLISSLQRRRRMHSLFLQIVHDKSNSCSRLVIRQPRVPFFC